MRSGGFIFGLVISLIVAMAAYAAVSYHKIEAGYVGVRVNLLGASKGVDAEVLGVGRWWVGWNQDLFRFPTFQQTALWSKPEDKHAGAFQFQSKEGLSLSADVSISYTVDASKVHLLFQRYRKGLDEITSVYLYNLVRDSMVQHASYRTAENLYGEGKQEFVTKVTDAVRAKMAPVGINVDYIAIVGNVWLPTQVKQSIDAKVQAGQLAAQRETEVATAKAEAEKAVAAADGEARSRKALADAAAYAILREAEAQREANEMLSKSITPELIEYNKISKWDGKLPQVTGGAGTLLNLK